MPPPPRTTRDATQQSQHPAGHDAFAATEPGRDDRPADTVVTVDPWAPTIPLALSDEPAKEVLQLDLTPPAIPRVLRRPRQ
jgi:hypothetical protein